MYTHPVYRMDITTSTIFATHFAVLITESSVLQYSLCYISLNSLPCTVFLFLFSLLVPFASLRWYSSSFFPFLFTYLLTSFSSYHFPIAFPSLSFCFLLLSSPSFLLVFTFSSLCPPCLITYCDIIPTPLSRESLTTKGSCRNNVFLLLSSGILSTAIA
jgi:hypothetical protein